MERESRKRKVTLMRGVRDKRSSNCRIVGKNRTTLTVQHQTKLHNNIQSLKQSIIEYDIPETNFTYTVDGIKIKVLA